MIDAWLEMDCEDLLKIKVSFKEYEDFMEWQADCRENDNDDS